MQSLLPMTVISKWFPPALDSWDFCFLFAPLPSCGGQSQSSFRPGTQLGSTHHVQPTLGPQSLCLSFLCAFSLCSPLKICVAAHWGTRRDLCIQCSGATAIASGDPDPSPAMATAVWGSTAEIQYGTGTPTTGRKQRGPVAFWKRMAEIW